VRTDKPGPCVQVVEHGRIVHRTVESGARGEIDGELWVAVQGIADGARVLRGSAGALREGARARLAEEGARP
jgi:hypothetical protein